MQELAILIPTYNRKGILERVIKALDNRLNGVRPTFFIGDDYGNIDGESISALNVDYVLFNKPTGSLGANLNRLIEAASEDFEYMLQLDDDHLLSKPINMDELMVEMGAGYRYAWLRLMGIGSHRYRASLDGSYWIIDWMSPELYITSNRPHLKHVSFHRHFGMYPVGKKLGETEEGFCHICKDRYMEDRISGDFTPNVAIKLGFDSEGSWEHIGHSWQDRGY